MPFSSTNSLCLGTYVSIVSVAFWSGSGSLFFLSIFLQLRHCLELSQIICSNFCQTKTLHYALIHFIPWICHCATCVSSLTSKWPWKANPSSHFRTLRQPQCVCSSDLCMILDFINLNCFFFLIYLLHCTKDYFCMKNKLLPQFNRVTYF